MKKRRLRILSIEKGGLVGNRIAGLFHKGRVSVDLEPKMDNVLEWFNSGYYDILLISSAVFQAGSSDEVELLEIVRRKSPGTQVLFLVETQHIRMAMSALKAGSYQYLKLPVGDEELRMAIETAFAERPLFEGEIQREPEAGQPKFEEMYGRCLPMQEVYRQIRQAASTDIPVLIVGETGTGKELAAKAVHLQSARAEGPFVPVNLGAVPTELVGSELFGNEKGAFTGADQKRKGKFEQAENGTLFLDEISNIDQKMQVSLLRVLEQKKVYRLGGRRGIPSNAVVVAASNEDLEELVLNGKFREDLFYRLDVFRIRMPPLRERKGDISLLLGEFIKRYARTFEKNIIGISPECVTILESYAWPGNVRELKNVIQRAMLVCPGEVILLDHLPPRFQSSKVPTNPKLTFEVGTTLEEMEREMIVRTLAMVQNNRTRAAELLGLSRRSLYNRLRKYGIE